MVKNKVSLFLSTYFALVLLICSSSCKDGDKRGDTKHKYTNALINETSPYLLQHAHNPVDWRAWSQEALDEAKEKNKLVLISIGYSSCHWCHVMEEETFENDSVAQIMNENYINIKVDREERPDVDQVYQTFVQLTGNNGGWPLNVIALPNGKPLYGGTYHTKSQWKQVLSKISKSYQENPEEATRYSDMVAEGIQEVNLIQPSSDFELLNEDTLSKSVEKWKVNWDTIWGGDRRNEKFMTPVNLDFLLDYAMLKNDKDALKQVELTLDKMALGGIYDHLGGGFFRYSTDPKWKVPHFEKMLYDNAQAISLYSKAYKVFKKESYKSVVLGTISFLEREMKNPEGGYYAALDADSEGEEGKFYVWTESELKSILGNDFELFASYYTIQSRAILEKDTYVLHKLIDDTAFIAKHSISNTTLEAHKKDWRQKLVSAREKRIRPRTDDKIITSWNALLIQGYADAYATFGNQEFLERAVSISDFIQSHSYKDGKLGHSHKKKAKHINAFLEDYSFLANAILRLYQVSLDKNHLELAKKLLETAKTNFDDEASGMYTYNQGNQLISKLIKTDDGVLPSPNSVMAHTLFQLGHIYYDTSDMKKSKTMLTSMIPELQDNIYAYAKWGSLLLYNAFPYYEVAVVGNNAKELLEDLHRQNIPNAILVGSTNESNLALFDERYSEGETYIYVCRDNSCKLPVKTVGEALTNLGLGDKIHRPMPYSDILK